MKKLIIVLPLIFWFGISFIEISAQILLSKDFYFWRAWEKVMTKPATYTSTYPFKPNAYFQGEIHGDLLNLMYFTPQKNEIREQVFTTDEHGFRNPNTVLKNPIAIVLLGTSLVAGASETDSQLVSTLLTQTYHLPTYNYATSPLQKFWEDKRFQENPPRFVVLLGKDTELLQNTDLTTLQDSKKFISVSPNATVQKNTFSYASFADTLSQFSLSRHILKRTTTRALNTVLPRNIIAKIIPRHSISYDAATNMLFLSPEQDNPTITEAVQTQITHAITRLKKTQEILAKRNSILLVATIPSKGALYAKEYQAIPKEKSLSIVFEKQLQDAGINTIPLASIMYAKKDTVNVYYPDDSHWSAAANQIIAETIAQEITK